MSSTWLYGAVAAGSLLLASMLALWQPMDAAVDALLGLDASAPPNAADRASQKIDEAVARHKTHWQERKAELRMQPASN